MRVLVVWAGAFSVLASVEDAAARLSVENQFRLNELWRWHQEHQCPQVCHLFNLRFIMQH
jgi:hypothetical protein